MGLNTRNRSKNFTGEKSSTYAEAHQKLTQILRDYVKSTPAKHFARDRISKSDIRIGHINGKPVNRLVMHLRSHGCGWKKSGGCTMCGFWSETTQMREKISVEDFLHQFETEIQNFDFTQLPILSIYNAGSMLNEEEVPFAALEKIFSVISRMPEIKRVILESRVDYVDFAKVKHLENILQGRELVIASGLESSDDIIRELCIHKGIPKKRFEDYVEKAHSSGTKIRIYVFIKPPFLTEKEAIDDAVRSTKYLWDLDVKDIHYETMTVEENTLVYDLYNRGLYKVPWLWSIIEIIKQVSSYTRPYISPFRYITDAKDVPHNCHRCSVRVTKAILEDYCSNFEVSPLERLECVCQAEWQEALKEKDDPVIERRVLNILNKLFPESEDSRSSDF